MKQCPVCKSVYTDDSLRFCLNDGAALVAPSSSSEITQQISGGSIPTVENNSPIRVHLQSETPTQLSIPKNTTQTERKGAGILPVLAVAALLVVAGVGAAVAYFAFIKPGNSIAGNSATPTNTAAPTQNSTPDDTQALKKKVEKLEKQLNEQKNARSNSSIPTVSPIQPPQTAVTARVNSPGDGFLALRSAPSVQNGYQILQIPHGAVVTVIGCQGYSAIGKSRGRWCRVNYDGREGWSFDAFLIY